MKYDICLIPGLGADERVFQHLRFPENTNITILRWISPKRNESLEDYCYRLQDQTTSDAAVIIGVSFGGMVAIELNKIRPASKVILISSAKTAKDLPAHVKFIGRSGILGLIPAMFFRWPNRFVQYLFGVKSKDQKQLLRKIIQDTNPDFVKWALKAISRWNYTGSAKNVITIHGTRDRLLPASNADYTIQGGGHFMIAENAEQVNRIIATILDQTLTDEKYGVT